MPEIVSDGDPFQIPQGGANEFYAKKTPASIGSFVLGTLQDAGTAYLGRAAERGAVTGSSSFDQGMAALTAQGGVADQPLIPTPEPIQSPEVAPEQYNELYAPRDASGKIVPIGDKPMPEALAQIIGRQKTEAMERESALSRFSETHWGPTTFVAGTLASMLDPINAGSLFIPGVGEGAIAARLGGGMLGRTVGRLAVGAEVGAVSQAPVTALKLGLSPEEAGDYGIRDAMRDMLYGAAGVALLHTGIGTAGELLGRGAERAAVPRETQTPEAAEPGTVAYHASPFNFDQFTLNHLGEGEGNQTFGRGLYFASERKVGEFYQDLFRRDGEPGQLYQVELAPKPHEYLDWDKPLSEQSPEIQGAVEQLAKQLPWRFFGADAALRPVWQSRLRNPETTGASIYRILSNGFRGDQAASEALQQFGIRGIRYLDQVSRVASEGSHNFVVFNPSDIRIRQAGAILSVDAPTKNAAMRAATAQIADGRAVDVAPIVPSAPAPVVPETAARAGTEAPARSGTVALDTSDEQLGTISEERAAAPAPPVREGPPAPPEDALPEFQTIRQAEAFEKRTAQEQAKRRELLSDPNALRRYADERGISPDELRDLLTNNYRTNADLLAGVRRFLGSDEAKARKETETANAATITFKPIEDAETAAANQRAAAERAEAAEEPPAPVVAPEAGEAAPAIALSDRILRNKYGEFYTGSKSPAELAGDTNAPRNVADQQRTLNREGWAPGVSRDELAASNEAVYAPKAEAERAPSTASAAGPAKPGTASPLDKEVAEAEQRLSVLTGGSAAAKPAATAPRKAAGYTTAKGSTYDVHEDGTTTRNKSFHPEHGEKDQGLQPRSEATFYVSAEDAQKLGEIQSIGGPSRIIAPLGDGRWGVKYLDGKDAGKFESRTVVTPVGENPAAGLTPVEIFNGGKRVHFGNEITEVRQAVAAPEGAAPIANSNLHPDDIAELNRTAEAVTKADTMRSAYESAAACIAGLI